MVGFYLPPQGALTRGGRLFNKPSWVMEVWYFLGFAVGDGSVYRNRKSRNYEVTIDQKYPENRRYIERISRELSRSKIKFYKYKLEFKGYQKVRLRVFGKDIFYLIKFLRTFPLMILDLKKKEFKNFLEGLIDSDGSVIEDRILIYSKDINFLYVLNLKLLELGMFGKIYKFGKVYGLQVAGSRRIRKLLSKILPMKSPSWG